MEGEGKTSSRTKMNGLRAQPPGDRSDMSARGRQAPPWAEQQTKGAKPFAARQLPGELHDSLPHYLNLRFLMCRRSSHLYMYRHGDKNDSKAPCSSQAPVLSCAPVLCPILNIDLGKGRPKALPPHNLALALRPSSPLHGLNTHRSPLSP